MQVSEFFKNHDWVNENVELYSAERHKEKPQCQCRRSFYINLHTMQDKNRDTLVLIVSY